MNRKRPRQTGKNAMNPAPGRASKPGKSRPGGPGGSGSAKPPRGARPGSRGPAAGPSGGRPAKSSPHSSSSSSSSAPRSFDRNGAPARWNPARGERPALPKGAPRSTTPRPGTPGKSGRPAGTSWGHSAPPSRARLEELLLGNGVALPAVTLDMVWRYHQVLRRNNHDLDLTRLIGFETIVQRHYADCLILHGMMKGQWPSPLVDIGTGAGFPGMMIKIASPATEVILSEPRNVRVDYLNNTITELGLKNISVFGHKFTSKSFQTPVRGVITRAFEPIAKTLPRLQYSLQVGGLAMFMKGPGVDEELSVKLPSDYKLVRDERYRIPKTTLDRAFVVFERVK